MGLERDSTKVLQTRDPRGYVIGPRRFIRYTCCTGYSREVTGKGCPITKPLTNIVETAGDKLFLSKFVALLTNTELEESLKFDGAFTAFVPVDEGFLNISYDDRERLHPWTFNAPSLVHYHVVKGRHSYSKFKKNQEIPTLYYGAKDVRINKYAYGVVTVNCARIIMPDQPASNGIIHVIDRMIKPLDSIGDLAEILLKQDRFSKFSQLLYKANLVKMLQGDRHFTIFAPNDAAFDRLPKIIKEKILTERKVAEAIAKYHIVKGVHCSASTIMTWGLNTLHSGSLTFRCKFNGNYVNEAKLLTEDIMAGNGVVHVIDKVLLPDSVKNMLEIAETYDTKTFVELARNAGLTDKIQTKKDVSLFIPNDDAFKALPPEYMASLREQPGIVEQMIDYHTVLGSFTTDKLRGNQLLDTELKPTKLKVSVFINGLTIDDAHLVIPDIESSNGVLHVIDKVLVPPGLNMIELLNVDEELSMFKDYVKKAGLTEKFTGGEQITVFAPSNEAFKKMSDYQKKFFLESESGIKMLLERHMVNGVVVSIGMSKDAIFTIPSIQSDSLNLTFDSDETTLRINKLSKGVTLDMLATNGILIKIDRVLVCESCKQVDIKKELL
ncbi:transforming growth factor-beta-induced protein ig-h3-like isoform X2 [Mytilus edulis]|uniref:transforming growth factor-beta-induced protein ig-h3-like isoform X2 n=1 Tax=Mytilus edulis TaxID=6550 RepID=UPI0039EF0853